MQNFSHFCELCGEKLAKQWPNVHAGKKIARAAGSSGRTGVVTELRMVKRQLHVRGHRHRAAFTDYISNAQSTAASKPPRRTPRTRRWNPEKRTGFFLPSSVSSVVENLFLLHRH